jgi:hypothetical protein
MATLFSDDFESGDFTAWSATTDEGTEVDFSVSSTNPISGSNSMLISWNTLSVQAAYATIDMVGADQDHEDYYIQFKLELDDLMMRNAGDYVQLLAIDNCGIGTPDIGMEITAGGVQYIGDPTDGALSTGTVYTVDIHYRQADSNGGFIVYLNDTLVLSDQSGDSLGCGVRDFSIGAVDTTAAVDPGAFRIDDVEIADTIIPGSAFDSTPLPLPQYIYG